jgi:RHS repeat-associated protein
MNTHLISLRHVVAVVSVIVLFGQARGQNPVQPKRGFYPAGSYALSDIESINTTNGNVILRIPLASLPGGRGGARASVGLFYNSKPYETLSWEDERYEGGAWSTMLRASDSGGWRYGFQYDVQLIDRFSENQPLHPSCVDTQTLYRWKVRVKFPDGSEHVFRPSGYTDELSDNYFRIQPDGWQYNGCEADTHVIFNGMTYYSADGSFMKLQFAPDGDHDWLNNAWTLSLPDGTRVTGGTAPQRIYDRNNNFIEIRNISYNGNPATEILDQLGRHIIVEYSPTGDYVRAWRTENGQLTELVWTITGGIANASQHSYYLNPNDIAFGGAVSGPACAVVRRIDLPAQTGGLSYTFTYNSDDPGTGWGEIATMTLPSGAQVIYEFLQGSYTLLAVDGLRNYVSQKQLKYQAEYDGTSTLVTDTWQYSLTESNSVITSPDGGQTREDFYQTNVETWNSGLVYKTQLPDGSVVERVWQQNIPYGYGTGIQPRANPYTKTEFHSIRNAAEALVSTAIKSYTYDKNGNVTQTSEYDWVPYGDVPRGGDGKPTGAIPGSAQIKRVSNTTFYNSTPSAESAVYDPDIYTQGSTPDFRQAASAVEVTNGTQVLSRTELFYDNPSTTANLTQKTNWDSTKGVYSSPLTTGNSISTSTQYNAYGAPVLITDGLGYQTQFVYGLINGFGDLYPTQVKNAYGTAIQRTESREYDFYGGLVTRVTDVDNNVSTATTYDVFGRPTLVKAAEGKPEETRTATEYSDTARRVIVRSDLTGIGDGKLVSIQRYDQLGRIRLTRQLEDATAQSAYDDTQGIKVQTRYLFDPPNHVSCQLSSNPYRANFSYNASSEGTMGWTRTKNDNGGRLIEVQTFGGATLPPPWAGNSTGTGRVLTAYDANSITVTDQAEKQRKSVTDALGRLIQIYEAPNDPNYNYLTTYSYDALDNLTTVNQGSQTRTFVYDSLKRLSSATNPESGTICYGHVVSGQCQNDGYDENGNLRFRTDARGVLTDFRYDALNRLTSKLYRINNQPDPNTPDVEYLYDNAANGKGRPWLTFTWAAQPFQTAIGEYDALGRVTQLYRLFGNGQGGWYPGYGISAQYDRAGHIKSMTYPSSRTLTNTFDGAGRLNSTTGSLGNVQTTYTTGIQYSVFGGMTKESFGTQQPLYHNLSYNTRGQLFYIGLGATNDDWGGDYGKLISYYGNAYSFGGSGPDDNGNVSLIDYYIPGGAVIHDHYAYDPLNRLKEVTEEDTAWRYKQKYDYDRYGNRTINKDPIQDGGSWGPINTTEFVRDPALNNQLLAPGDSALPLTSRRMQYDQAGNLKWDSYTGQGSRTYDAENRMVAAAGSPSGSYRYDGDGNRIKRIVGTSETWQIYGIGGELLAEYAANASPASPEREYGYRNGELLVTADATSSGGGERTNVALASNGATASSSSAYPGYGPSGANNGGRKGDSANDYWNDDAPANTFPDWLQIDFNGSKTIDEIDVFTVQDNWQNPSEPTETMTFTQYGLTGFDVQYWNGSSWATVPGGSVSGNNKVWKKVTFSPITANKIRVLTNASPDGYSRITELEAWSAAPPPTNVARAANGATASASSAYPGYGASGANNGGRKGDSASDYWNDDAPANTFPDWLQIDFNGSKTIDEIDVFTVQDNWQNPVEPTETMTFSLYGLTAFDLQYWTGSAWATVPGGSVSGNNKVWKKITFSPITTTKIRLLTNASPDGYSRVTELEAWGTAAGSSAAQINWLVPDHLGTPRMIADSTGSLAGIKRHDYLPFGEEIAANVGVRSPGLGYTADSVRQKFTQKERDNETGLDYFNARYYSSNQGRFTSPDEFAGGPDELFVRSGDSKKQAIPYAELAQPQSLNKYAYVYNNPCRYTDPDGHCGTPKGLKPGQVGICVASYISSRLVSVFGIPTPGKGDNRGPNGQGGSSRIEVRVVVDPAKGTVEKTNEAMGTSGIVHKELGPKGTGGVDVGGLGKDEKGNLYFQIHQNGESRIAGVFGNIENHLNMVVTTDSRVGITDSSTAKDFPSLEVYKYTMDAKGNVTTTLITNKRESGNIRDLGKPEKPIKADPQ